MAKANQIAAKELRERGKAELESLLVSKTEELQKVRFKHALGQLRTTHTLLALRREIARITTIMHEQSVKPSLDASKGT
ncbi:MAG: 50S ribosomal protein L29 [Deltaproteobacteria bacterium]|nr:50S ribosomal protein L29 [Deltaproteobacteria bacterium]